MSDLQKLIKRLLTYSEMLESSQSQNLLNASKGTLERQSFHLVVLGEFKRGKSTLINSLLGEEILPADILPTSAVVTVIQYEEKRELRLSFENGNIESLELSERNLLRLTYEGNEDNAKVRHALITLPAPVLKDGLVLIDTPGVNDLNESRAAVTYGILPHADAALFLLDAAAPLTRSEADFLTTKVLTHKLESIQFLISKIDRLSESEQAESLSGAEERIDQVLGRKLSVFPYSVVPDSENDKPEVLNYYHSELISKISELEVEAQKTMKQRVVANMKLAINVIQEECRSRLALQNADRDQLVQLEERLQFQKDERDLRFQKFVLSIELVGHETLVKMIHVSTDKFFTNVERDLSNDIRTQDQHLKKFWEYQLPKFIERSLRQFSEAKVIEIRSYLEKFTLHLDQEYQKNFQNKLTLDMQKCGINIEGFKAEIAHDQEGEISSMLQHQGFAVAGMVLGSIVTLGMGTMIGAALGQVAGKVFGDKKNKELKSQYLAELPQFIHVLQSDYLRQIEKSVAIWFTQIKADIEKFHSSNESSLMKSLADTTDPDKSQTDGNEIDLEKIITETMAIKSNLN